MKRVVNFPRYQTLILNNLFKRVAFPAKKRWVYWISRLLDSKLDKRFSEFKRGLEQKELATNTQIKKLKSEAKASSSFQLKGNKLQFEFISSLLDSTNSASTHLLEENLSGVNTELENAKTLLNKRNKVIRLADKSSVGWTAVEEYESDELADDFGW